MVKSIAEGFNVLYHSNYEVELTIVKILLIVRFNATTQAFSEKK